MKDWAVCVMFVTVVSQSLPGATGYYVHNLVADTPGVADFTDPNLVNPWGNVASATSPLWICDAGTGLSTVYTVNDSFPGAALGTPSALKPAVPGAGGAANGPCTGIVANLVSATSPTSFNFSSPTAPTPKPASFIFVTEDGTLSAWANAVDPAHAILLVDNSNTAVYKGLALVTSPAPQLYAANFKAGTIDVFDDHFKPVTLSSGAFTDPAIPAGFAPFNIWYLNGNLYVAYAKQDANKKFDVPAPGNGFVDAYDYTGKLLRHLVAKGPLNSPWGMAIAPSTFGQFAGALLVGNFGDGTINAFETTGGGFLGTLQDASGMNIVIPGLWSLLFGNGSSGGDKDALYFTAGPGGEKHGLLGSIQAAPVVTDSSLFNNGQGAAGIAANTIVGIVGKNMAATKRTWAASDVTDGNQLPTSLDGVTVTVNGEAAYICYISPVQINLLMPADVPTTGKVVITVSNHGLTSGSINATMKAIAPAFFLFNSDKYVAATHSDNKTPVGPTTLFANSSKPTKPGETIVLYGTGFGTTNPPVVNGQTVTAALPLAITPQITFNTTAGTVVFAGETSPGLYQFNVTVPQGLIDGDAAVVASINGVITPAGAFITIQN